MANLDLYNNPFNNYVQRNYVQQTPQNRLQTAYNQAMQKKTPEWARTVSDIMPSLAEIGAYFGTKGAFNRGTIANSLEREKDRRTAYNQMMRENEDKMANDYVQMAKEQLGMDLAQDDREFQRNQAQLNRDERLEAQKRAYEQWLDEQEMRRKNQEIDNETKIIANNLAQDKFNFDKERQSAIELQQQKENAFKDRQLKLQEEQANQQALTKAIEESAKAKQKQLDGYVSTAENMFNKGLISNETLWAIKQNPELAETLVPKSTWLGFAKSSKKMELGDKTNNDYEIMQDANGNRAKVYKNGRIEEL